MRSIFLYRIRFTVYTNKRESDPKLLHTDYESRILKF